MNEQMDRIKNFQAKMGTWEICHPEDPTVKFTWKDLEFLQDLGLFEENRAREEGYRVGVLNGIHEAMDIASRKQPYFDLAKRWEELNGEPTKSWDEVRKGVER